MGLAQDFVHVVLDFVLAALDYQVLLPTAQHGRFVPQHCQRLQQLPVLAQQLVLVLRQPQHLRQLDPQPVPPLGVVALRVVIHLFIVARFAQ